MGVWGVYGHRGCMDWVYGVYVGVRGVWAGCILILGIYFLYRMTKGCRPMGWVYIDIYIFGEYLPFSNIFRNIRPGGYL